VKCRASLGLQGNVGKWVSQVRDRTATGAASMQIMASESFHSKTSIPKAIDCWTSGPAQRLSVSHGELKSKNLNSCVNSTGSLTTRFLE